MMEPILKSLHLFDQKYQSLSGAPSVWYQAAANGPTKSDTSLSLSLYWSDRGYLLFFHPLCNNITTLGLCIVRGRVDLRDNYF